MARGRMVSMTSDSAAETAAPEPAWLESLPVDDRQLYRDEWTAAPAHEREQLVREWQQTAAVHANRKLARRLSRPLTV